MDSIRYLLHVAGAIALATIGCGERRVESTYRPPPPQINHEVTLPDMNFRANAPSPPATIPSGKGIQLRGRIVGVNGFDRWIDRPFIAIRPEGNPKRMDANAWMAKKLVGSDVIEYTALFETLDRTGPKELWFYLGQEHDLVVRATVR